MESGDAHRQGAGRAHRVLTKVQVAMAMAVIKSRPPGTTSREYAEALAHRLVVQDSGLRTRVQELQQEVLRLRQELVMSKAATTGVVPTMEATAQEVDATSQDLFSPESCSTATLSLQATPPLEATPLLAPVMRRKTPPSLRFLQLLCELHQVGGQQRPLGWLWSGSGGDTVPLVVDSVCCLLGSVVAQAAASTTGHAASSAPAGIACELVLEACQVASRATQLLCSQGVLTDQDMRQLEAPLAQLTESLLNWDQISGVQTADTVAEQLLALGSGCSLFRSFLLRHFLSEVGGVAKQLWEAHQGQHSLEFFPVQRYLNSCLLLWVLETLLQLGPVPVAIGPAHILQRVFQLADEFPLFAICVWRVVRLLQESYSP